MMNPKNEFSHSSIDHLSIAKYEKKKFPLEEILLAVLAIGLIGIGYCNHVKTENEKKAVSYTVNYSTKPFTSSYLGEYKK